MVSAIYNQILHLRIYTTQIHHPPCATITGNRILTNQLATLAQLVRPQHLPHLLAQATLSATIVLVIVIELGRSCQRAREAELAGHAFDAVRGVDVLDEGDLVAGCGALAGDDGRVGEEVLPDLEWGRGGWD